MGSASMIRLTVYVPCVGFLKIHLIQEQETASRINILEFCEEHYEDILPVMDKICHGKQREAIEGKVHSNDLATLTHQARLSPIRTGNTLEMIPIVEVVLTNETLLLAEIVLEAEAAPTTSKNRHRRESAFKRLSDTYSPSTTKSDLDREYSRDDSHSRGRPHKRNSSPSRDRPRSRGRSHDIEESYVRSPSSYNGIIGRPRVREIQAVPSTSHRMLKFPVKGGIVTICSYILTPNECTTIAATPKDHAKKAEICHKNFKVAIHPDFSDQEITIGGIVSIKAQTELCTLLKRNLDIFAWQPSDTTRVPRLIDEHRLNIREGYSHVRQKNKGRPRSAPRSNPSAATPLSVSWTPTYHQIQMAEQDEEKTAFHTSHGIYVDELVIKSHTETELLLDIEEMFRTLRRINMKLNPKICTFGAAEEMFLGYMINSEGIKSCPNKTEVVLQLPSPQTIKEVHSLNGKLASLNRFISKSAEKSLPLFKTVKKCIKKSDFHWMPDAEQAFKQLKQHLARLPMLVAPKPKEELIMYLFASYGAINFLFEKPDDASPKASVTETSQEPWILFTDGSSCVDGSGTGLILTSPKGTEFTYAIRF
nr:reverse transcriptase domain-containing protein [Tanacetum cinerariifolium]